MLVILAFGRLKQENQEFQIGLNYIVRLCLLSKKKRGEGCRGKEREKEGESETDCERSLISRTLSHIKPWV